MTEHVNIKWECDYCNIRINPKKPPRGLVYRIFIPPGWSIWPPMESENALLKSSYVGVGGRIEQTRHFCSDEHRLEWLRVNHPEEYERLQHG